MNTSTYTPRYKPYEHQAEAYNLLEGKEAFALLMAMRTGKTKVIIDDFGRLEKEGKVVNLLVIAPGGVYKTWKAQFEDHASEDLGQRTLIHVWKSGKAKSQSMLRKQFLETSDQPRVLVINIEALSRVKEAQNVAVDFLKQGPSMLVIDESTTIKNPSSKRTKFVLKALAPHADYRRILSGLPTPRSPLDLYSQFSFLDQRILGYPSYYAFRARYANLVPRVFGGRRVQIVDGYRDIDHLQAKIAPYRYRKRLEDCYDLPQKVYLTRDVELTAEQKRLYKEMLEFATTQLESEDHVVATVVIVQILKLHQILCGHVKDELGNVHDIPENRTAELLELLDEHDGKAIIWCSYDHDVNKVTAALEKEFGKGTVARFWGGNTKGREDEEARFKNDPKCLFMVATAAAGGRGREWSVANLVVYYSNTNDLEHRSQSEERAQAIGKKDYVTYVDLRVPDTVDDKIIYALRNKIDMASAINGDNLKEWLI